ncbi:unnamed protein product [Brugia pahangi]|uniref:XdhC_C domain-containing protein n=1 Tax=Brugia pahangi TaxID=6280 RepID=A0A0N4TTI9_BRUPA|nr:unnamed protein product [Brugia pahangi]
MTSNTVKNSIISKQSEFGIKKYAIVSILEGKGLLKSAKEMSPIVEIEIDIVKDKKTVTANSACTACIHALIAINGDRTYL